MYPATKKCPFSDKPTLPINARSYTECNNNGCRFQVGDRCMIIENHDRAIRLEMKLDAIMKATGVVLRP